jgi:hypothetical protein
MAIAICIEADALGDVVELFVNGADVIRAQVNRVPMPNPCVVLTEINQIDLHVPRMDYTPDDDIATITGNAQINVQVDFYGINAGDWCKSVKSALRSQWAYGKFPAGINPLYTDDGRQSPLITGEQQYESRWSLTVALQYNPSVDVPQDFADVLSVDVLRPVDVF